MSAPDDPPQDGFAGGGAVTFAAGVEDATVSDSTEMAAITAVASHSTASEIPVMRATCLCDIVWVLSPEKFEGCGLDMYGGVTRGRRRPFPKHPPNGGFLAFQVTPGREWEQL